MAERDEIEGLSEAPCAAYDRFGRQIMVGDVLKVYHFRGARWNKDYYMYKQVLREVRLGESEARYLFVSHLGLKADDGYHLSQIGETHHDVEIVQGLDWYHDRPRRKD